MRTEHATFPLAVEYRQRAEDGVVEIGPVYLAGSRMPLPPSVMTAAFKYALMQALAFKGKLDDESDDAVRAEIERAM